MTKFRKSAGIVPVRYVNEQWEVLLLRAYAYWDFPKGEVEEDEDPWTAALRELEEETGIEQVKTRWGKSFLETAPYGKGKVARYYLAEVSAGAEVILRPEPETGIYEHHEWRWLTFEEANELLVPRLQKIIDWARTQMLAS